MSKMWASLHLGTWIQFPKSSSDRWEAGHRPQLSFQVQTGRTNDSSYTLCQLQVVTAKIILLTSQSLQEGTTKSKQLTKELTWWTARQCLLHKDVDIKISRQDEELEADTVQDKNSERLFLCAKGNHYRDQRCEILRKKSSSLPTAQLQLNSSSHTYPPSLVTTFLHFHSFSY